jgi:hypothetical protein
VKKWPLVLLLLPGRAAAAEVHTSINDVRACSVTNSGITLATSGGVAKLSKDGRVEKVLTALDGLPDGRALSLSGDWVGTDRGAFNLSTKRVVGAAPVRAILETSNETYFATWGKGVLKLSGGDVPYATPTPLRARVSSLAMHNGTLVAGTAAGTLRVDNGKLSPFGPTTATFALTTLGDRLYVGGLEGLLSIASGVTRHESDADVRALLVSNNDVLAATFGAGVLRVGKTITTANKTPFAQALGNGCIGTSDGVIVGEARYATGGLPSPDVASIAVEGSKIYVGTFDRGLAVIEDGKVRRIEGVDKQINALAIDHGVIWAGTARGLYRIKDSTVKHYGEAEGLPSADVHALAVVKGRVLVGTSKGAALVGANVEALSKKQGVTSDAVWAVAEHDGELWLGTNAGLFIGKPGKTFRRLSKLTGELNDDWITALAFAGDKVYVGSYSGGVTELSGKTVARLGGGYINPDGLRVIDGKLYAATMDGLLVRDGAFRRVDKGVLGSDVTSVLPSPKGMIIATRRGLTIGY